MAFNHIYRRLVFLNKYFENHSSSNAQLAIQKNRLQRDMSIFSTLFAAICKKLKLEHPGKMDVAVLSLLHCSEEEKRRVAAVPSQNTPLCCH